MDDLFLLTDGSVNTLAGIGFGAYLTVRPGELAGDAVRARVKVRRFAPTSSTRLELQTLLWALTEVSGLALKVTVYTDSQNIVGLPGRRKRLEESDYFSAKKRRLSNQELYREFYRLTALQACAFVKVKGHQPAGQKDDLARLFALVDRAARQALQEGQR